MNPSRRQLLTRTAPAAAAGLLAAPLLGAASSASAAPIGPVPFMLFPNFRLWDTRGEAKLTPASREKFYYPGDIIKNPYVLMLNLTVTETVGAGYLRLGDDFVDPSNEFGLTSNVNWYASGQTNANFAMVRCFTEPGKGVGVAIQGGGATGSSTHLVVDLVGYIPEGPYLAYQPEEGG